MSDLSLRKAIMEELEFQPQIDAASIGVAVENGVVTLTGHVSSYEQKVCAERAVKGIKRRARSRRGDPGAPAQRRRNRGRHPSPPAP